MKVLELPRIPPWMMFAATFLWLGFIAVSAAATGRNGFWWHLLAGVAATMAGIAFAASALGLFLERWRRREFRRRSRLICLDLVIAAQNALRAAVVEAYGTITPALQALGHMPLSLIEAGVHVPVSSGNRAILAAARADALQVSRAASHAEKEHNRTAKYFQDRCMAETSLAASLLIGGTPEPLVPPPEPPGPLPDSQFQGVIALPQAGAELVGRRVLASNVSDYCHVACERLLDVTGYTGNETLAWKLAQAALNIRNIGDKWANAVTEYRKQASLDAHAQEKASQPENPEERAALARAEVDRKHWRRSAADGRETGFARQAADHTDRLLQGLYLSPDLLDQLSEVYEEVATGHLHRVTRPNRQLRKVLRDFDTLIITQQAVDLTAGIGEVELLMRAEVEGSRTMRGELDKQREPRRRGSPDHFEANTGQV